MNITLSIEERVAENAREAARRQWRRAGQAAINKLKIPYADIREQMQFWEQYEVVQVTPAIIHMGLDLHQTRHLSFFDALIVAAAKTSGCTVLYSEDMKAGELVDGVRGTDCEPVQGLAARFYFLI